MKRTLAIMVLCLVFLGIGYPANAVTKTLPECKSEDSNNCAWNAATRGNGKGKSFIVLKNKVYYLS